MISTHTNFRYAAICLAISIALFILHLLFLGKPLYALFADLFQSGQMYQGETRALMYNRFLFIVLAPCSLFLSAMLVWIFIRSKKHNNRKIQ
jgi:Na+-transporting NADH:ubiquinone oxidoreductase subunit NqrD